MKKGGAGNLRYFYEREISIYQCGGITFLRIIDRLLIDIETIVHSKIN